jgi:hypothetical protein
MKKAIILLIIFMLIGGVAIAQYLDIDKDTQYEDAIPTPILTIGSSPALIVHDEKMQELLRLSWESGNLEITFPTGEPSEAVKKFFEWLELYTDLKKIIALDELDACEKKLKEIQDVLDSGEKGK